MRGIVGVRGKEGDGEGRGKWQGGRREGVRGKEGDGEGSGKW